MGRTGKVTRAALVPGQRVLGIVFLALLLSFTWFTYAVFSKQFSDYDEVTLRSSKIGLQLPARADVKIRGVIVGEVLDVSTDGDGAEIRLGLHPQTREIIPANVTARILPKTLFGEKYVALQVPRRPAARPIEAGDTIRQARVAIELEELLRDIFPLLRTVQPAELNYTLTALANALEGRGERIGESLETLDRYLRRTNPQLPLLIDDLRRLGSVSQTYAGAVPDLARLLRNSVRTGETFVSMEDRIEALFADVTGFARTSRGFLERNGDNLIRVSEQGRQILPVFAKHSPAFDCFLEGAFHLIAPNVEVFRDKTLHIVLEPLPRQPRGYGVQDLPEFDDHRGAFPYCEDLRKGIDGYYGQHRPIPPRLIPDIQDGVDYPVAKRVAPFATDAVAATSDEQALVDALAAPVVGVRTSDVPDLATLLFAPLARGTEVSLR